MIVILWIGRWPCVCAAPSGVFNRWESALLPPSFPTVACPSTNCRLSFLWCCETPSSAVLTAPVFG